MINRSEQALEQRLVKELADLRRELEALKVKQLVGADSLSLRSSGVVEGVAVLGPNQNLYWSPTITFGSGVTANAVPSMGVRVDVDDIEHSLFESAHYPEVGSALTIDQRNALASISVVRDGTDFGDARLNGYMWVLNRDSVSHTYYVSVRWYILSNTGVESQTGVA